MDGFEQAMLAAGMGFWGDDYSSYRTPVVATAQAEPRMFQFVTAAAFTPTGRAIREEFGRREYERLVARLLAERRVQARYAPPRIVPAEEFMPLATGRAEGLKKRAAAIKAVQCAINPAAPG